MEIYSKSQSFARQTIGLLVNPLTVAKTEREMGGVREGEKEYTTLCNLALEVKNFDLSNQAPDESVFF